MRIFAQDLVREFIPAFCGLLIAAPLSAQIVPRGNEHPDTVRNRQVVSSTPMTSDAEKLRPENLVAEATSQTSVLRVQALEAVDSSATIAPDVANRLLQDGLEDKDPLVRETSLRALLHRGDEQLLFLRESDLKKISGETGDLAHVELAAHNQNTSALRELMLSGDAVVQERAFEALATTDRDGAVELLRNEFLDAGSLYRLQTLELFVRSPYANSEETLMPILELASKDTDPLVQSRATELLDKKASEAKRRVEATVQQSISPDKSSSDR